MIARTTPPRATFQEQVREKLGRDICSGRYRPGQVLPSETDLCQQFGFSRIVIREAIKSLVAKGMLEVGRRVGTLVLEPTQWNLFDPNVITWRAESADQDPTISRDLMELRRIVEPAAVRLTATRAGDEDRRKLRAAYMAMARAVAGKGDYVQADLAFHAVILAACGNQFVRQMQEAMSAILRASFEIISNKPGGPAHSLPMHEAVCVAIEKGDPVAAERAAINLIEQAEADLKEQLNSRRSVDVADPSAAPESESETVV
jgi:DNA-binding FadR family transcriptional regulator